MTQNIHPTAYIATDAVLGEHIIVGPFAVIESGVELGDACQIGAHAVIQPFVKMGSGNILHPHAVLGDLPQDTSFKAETVSWLIIGDNNVFREGFTAHRSSKESAATPSLPIMLPSVVMWKSAAMFLWVARWLSINFAVLVLTR